MNAISEVWKPAAGYETTHEVSNFGNVRRVLANLKFTSKKARYVRFMLLARRGTVSCHRLVWKTFMGPIPSGMQVNHKNGNTHDNTLTNLEVVTPSQNVRHRFDILKRHAPRGSQRPDAKITETDVADIIKAYAKGAYIRDIGRPYSLSGGAISSIVEGRSWKHVDRSKLPKTKPRFARLTEEQVKRIFLRARKGERRAVLAAEFGTCRANIDFIISGKRWKNLTASL